MKKESKISIALKNNQGFTLLELMAVIGIIAVLTAMAAFSAFDARKKANDTLALNDARNMITVVHDNFFNKTDVSYDTGGWTSGPLGTLTSPPGSTARPAVYNLSPGVKAYAIGRSSPAQLGNITLYTHHTAGTGVSFSLCPVTANVKSFYVYIDESSGDVDITF